MTMAVGESTGVANEGIAIDGDACLVIDCASLSTDTGLGYGPFGLDLGLGPEFQF
jgi:hypothetical protein